MTCNLKNQTTKILRDFMSLSLGVFVMTSSGFSDSFIETQGRFEMNWTTGRTQYFGASALDSATDESWRSAEQRAWSEGLDHLQKALPDAYCSSREGVCQEKPKVTDAVASTTSKLTTYYGTGQIKVVLEAPLSILGPSGQSFSGSGEQVVQIHVKGRITPTVTTRFVDESGQDLPGTSALSGRAVGHGLTYHKRKMDGTAQNGIILNALSAKPGVIVIARNDWATQVPQDLSQARVAVIQK